VCARRKEREVLEVTTARRASAGQEGVQRGRGERSKRGGVAVRGEGVA
jgi:hypothetical protein